MKNVFLLLLLICMPAAAAFPQTGTEKDDSMKKLNEIMARVPVTMWGDSAESGVTYSLADNYRVITIKQKEYLPVYYGPLNLRVIVAQQTKRILDERHEGEHQQLSAECYMIGADNKVHKIWTLREEAGQGYLHDFYETVQKGCCSLQDNHRLFSIGAGKLVMEHTSELLHTGIKNSGNERFIGYKSAETYNTSEYEKEKLYVGTVTYASADSAISRIIIKAKSKQERDDYFGVGYGKINFGCSNNPGTDVNIIFFGGYKITIPIKNDSLAIENQDYDHYTLEYIK